MISQCLSYLPVPVSTNTITPAKPDPEYEPGESREQHRDQMPFSCFGKGPAADIEQSEDAVKYEEKDIEKMIPHACCLKPEGKISNIKEKKGSYNKTLYKTIILFCLNNDRLSYPVYGLTGNPIRLQPVHQSLHRPPGYAY